MTAICPSSILACGMRVTLLDSLGDVAPGPNNSYVTDGLIQIQFTPDLFVPPEREQVSGCNCVIASAKFPSLLKRFDLTIDKGQLEPGLESLMTGADVVLSGPDPIGAWWPNNAQCGETPPPFVALEVWSQAYEGNAQSEVLPNIHWVWPKTQWVLGQSTLNNDIKQDQLVGFSIPNSLWGQGPYGDGPGENVGPMGGYWFTADDPPAAACGYATVVPSS
jgi:hypothetical protein